VSVRATEMPRRQYRFAGRSDRLSGRADEMLDALERRSAELAWIRACSVLEAARLAHDPTGVQRDTLSRQTFEAMERCVLDGRINAGELAVLTKHGRTDRPLSRARSPRSRARTPGLRCAVA
jgi:hypothetical protein